MSRSWSPSRSIDPSPSRSRPQQPTPSQRNMLICRTRAIGCGLKRGVVAADRTREADNRIAAEPAASEVVHLEVAGGFVEAEVVEEIVREVEREEERRLGAPGGLQRKIERPLCAVEHARLASDAAVFRKTWLLLPDSRPVDPRTVAGSGTAKPGLATRSSLLAGNRQRPWGAAPDAARRGASLPPIAARVPGLRRRGSCPPGALHRTRHPRRRRSAAGRRRARCPPAMRAEAHRSSETMQA